jgi:hypothetical protein
LIQPIEIDLGSDEVSFSRSPLPLGLSTLMKRYDPLKPPDTEQWRSIDEQAQIQIVQDYHRRARIRLPNAMLHAVVHVTVENQIALGDETPVRRTVQRLISEGLDRHEAIHAVGSVLAGYINDLLRGGDPGAEPISAYYVALDHLTAKEWLRSG